MSPVLAIGPANYAGQAHAWASALNRFSDARAWSFHRGPIRRGGFQFEADVTIPAPLFHLGLARGPRFAHLLRRTTHVALDGFKPMFRLRREGIFEPDARAVLRLGKPLALIAHGTDVRDPAAHQARERWSYFNEGSPEWRAALTTSTAYNRHLADTLGVPVFYSTPDLGLDLPQATWLPVTVDIDAWTTTNPLLERTRPRVLHIPSRRNPPIKGTQYIEPVLQRLHDRGLIEYIAPHGVPHAEMRRLVQDSDVVVDQVLFGSYGVMAVEGMAAGRVTIGTISDPVAALMPEQPRMLPADPDTLEDVILSIPDRADELRADAITNHAYVTRWHNGQAAAAALSAFVR